MGFFSQLKEGIKTLIKDVKEGKAVAKVKNKMEEAFKPIPGELRKQYIFWDTRHFDDEVNALLANIAKAVSPEVTQALLTKINNTYKDVGSDFIEDIVDMEKINKVAKQILKNLQDVVKEF